MRSEQEVRRAIERYSNTVNRICMTHLKNYHDTEDIFQTVFLKYALNSVEFENDEHEKAWIIRVTINACKDLLKSFFRNRTVPLDEIILKTEDNSNENSEVLEAVLSLPQKYRTVVYLHYYEGYTAVEIAKMLNKNENTVYTHLTRAKKMLKDILGGD
ncbi:MAG: sigma-70 family RNA polymerase sigma factor [Clostridia bacterium]|nr:sigma-70 family RNA polymerase sigma factor [Clostridia bacterium]